MFHQCVANVLPVFHTISHQVFISVSKVFHQCFKSILKVFHKCFEVVCLLSQLPVHMEGLFKACTASFTAPKHSLLCSDGSQLVIVLYCKHPNEFCEELKGFERIIYFLLIIRSNTQF